MFAQTNKLRASQKMISQTKKGLTLHEMSTHQKKMFIQKYAVHLPWSVMCAPPKEGSAYCLACQILTVTGCS
jgi:hypothetical protein